MPRKAALKASPAIDEPNVIIPLATSYNERGVQGFTHSVTNSEDQRKVNCLYELAKNPMTGKGTLTLAKRPGVTLYGTTYGTGTLSTAHLPINTLNVTSFTIGALVIPDRVVLGTDGTNIKSYTPTGQRTITSFSTPPGLVAAFSEITAISNVNNLVAQLEDTVGTQQVYFITIADLLANNAWTQISDADFTGFPPQGKMEFIDGFAFSLTSTNLVINSDTNSLANWTASNFLAKQIKIDRPVGLARQENKLLAFGEETVEAFYNAGNTTGSPLGRIAHLHQRIGLIRTVRGSGTHYYATLVNRIYFVGRRAGGSSSIGAFVFDGQSYEEISSPYISKILAEKAASIYSVYPMGLHGRAGIAIGLTDRAATTQRALVFFPDWKEWFEWTSSVFSIINDGEFFLAAGGVNQKTLYSFTASDNWQDAGTSYPWFTQFKLPTNGSSRRFMHMYGVDADTDASANDLAVEISTNDCVSFSTLGTIDQTQDRKVLFRGGSFRKAHIRLGNTNARPTRIHNFLARIE